MKKLLMKIKSYISILILVNVLVKSFKKGIKAVLLREEKEPGYLAQNQFESCMDRAKAIIMEAINKPLHILALAIALHREKFHKESHLKEKADLSRQMTAKEVKISARGFWNL